MQDLDWLASVAISLGYSAEFQAGGGHRSEASLEELGDQVGQIIPPVAPDVSFLRSHEGVADVVPVERIVQALRSGEQGVRLAAGQVKQLQLLVSRSAIGEEILELFL